MPTLLDYRRAQVGAAAKATTLPSPIPGTPAPMPVQVHHAATQVQSYRITMSGEELDTSIRHLSRVTDLLVKQDGYKDTWGELYCLKAMLKKVREKGSRFGKK